jgi:glycosyltransferase involved in cell wall biosynthesis
MQSARLRDGEDDTRRSQRAPAAILVYDLRASGVARNALRIAKAAAEAGLAPELWVVRGIGEFMAETGGIPVRVIAKGTPHLPRVADSTVTLPALVAALRSARPAVLLSSGNHMHAFACAAHRLSGVSETRLIGRASNALAAATPPKHAGLAARLIRRSAIAIERAQFGMMDGVIAVSRELGDDLRRHGVSPARLAVIPNGVDIDAIGRAAKAPAHHPWFADGAPPVVIAVGRLSMQKDFPTLIRAFAAARQVQAMRLVILGDGPAAECARLTTLADTLGIAADLWLGGYQANPHAFVARAALSALSSRWEGASNVLIEALACGTPVIATACPTGVREVLTEGCGSVVPVGDDAAMARAILARLARPRDSAACRARAADFSLRAMMDGYARYLRDAVPDRDQ